MRNLVWFIKATQKNVQSDNVHKIITKYNTKKSNGTQKKVPTHHRSDLKNNFKEILRCSWGSDRNCGFGFVHNVHQKLESG